MTTRRSSARLSGGSDNLDTTGKNGHVSAKKRSGDDSDAIGIETERKKRKTMVGSARSYRVE
jgi:hypothetical protein